MKLHLMYFIFPLTILFCEASTQFYSFTSIQMGVDFRIDLYALDKKSANTAAEAAFKRIEQINRIMSDYLVESEISYLSKSSGSNQSIPVSHELWNILTQSKHLHAISKGAFDISAGPLILLWRKARFTKQYPSTKYLTQARGKSGMHHILFNPKSRSVMLKEKGMRLDLGAIAKGYAVDEALEILKNHNIKYALVDGGGDIAMAEHPQNKWKIFISNENNQISEYLLIDNVAVATSGNASQHTKINNQNYSHVIDPRTGIALTNTIQVTVIADNATTADSLASAVMVMGAKSGLELIESIPHVETHIITPNLTYQSGGFPPIKNIYNN